MNPNEPESELRIALREFVQEHEDLEWHENHFVIYASGFARVFPISQVEEILESRYQFLLFTNFGKGQALDQVLQMIDESNYVDDQVATGTTQVGETLTATGNWDYHPITTITGVQASQTGNHGTWEDVPFTANDDGTVTLLENPEPSSTSNKDLSSFVREANKKVEPTPDWVLEFESELEDIEMADSGEEEIDYSVMRDVYGEMINDVEQENERIRWAAGRRGGRTFDREFEAGWRDPQLPEEGAAIRDGQLYAWGQRNAHYRIYPMNVEIEEGQEDVEDPFPVVNEETLIHTDREQLNNLYEEVQPTIITTTGDGDPNWFHEGFLPPVGDELEAPRPTYEDEVLANSPDVFWRLNQSGTLGDED